MREFVAGSHQRKAERDQSITQAWLTVALALGSKRVPPLEQLLTGGTTKQTPEQQRSMLLNMAARYGIELERTELIPKH